MGRGVWGCGVTFPFPELGVFFVVWVTGVKSGRPPGPVD